MSFLIDSNVLISSFDETEKQHKDSYSVVERAMNKELDGVLAHQNLLEYLAVVTDPKRVENPLSSEEAVINVDLYVAALSVILPKPTTTATFKKFLREKPVGKGRVFDIYLAATAFDNDINEICTWNTSDFQGLSGIATITPKQVLKDLRNKG
jgi:predicted nucleic acid-binding protein